MAYRLVVGLGNPGSAYANTRHNVGFDVLDRWVHAEGIAFRDDKRGPVETARQGDVTFIKPLTFMNDSGSAVKAWLDWLKLPPSEVLVVVDDVALMLGDVRLRKGGSAGGHNGLRSIEGRIGTGAYARLRCGIGPQPPMWALEDFVLGRFGPGEEEARRTLLETAVEALRCCQHEGINVAMNRFNGRSRPESQ
jgi:peptidyl-tRNA hydrolase, PTH1 family